VDAGPPADLLQESELTNSGSIFFNQDSKLPLVRTDHEAERDSPEAPFGETVFAAVDRAVSHTNAAVGLRPLPTTPLVTKDGPHSQPRWGPTAPRYANIVLTPRATGVPFTAVPSGQPQTTTDNTKAAPTSAVRHLLRSRSCPIWLWEQGVALVDAMIGPAVPAVF